jgi:hypothetical protein
MHRTLVSVLLLLVATAVYGLDRPPTEWTGIPDIYSLPSSTPDRRGTEVQPFVVDQSQEALRREEAEQAEHASNERWMTIATIVLAVFTVALWLANVWLVLESRRVSARQGQDTRDAIREATRSANAMQDVANATKNNALLMQNMWRQQMRAYLAVDLGSAIYQDEHHVFEAMPVLTNFGLTPARKVCFRLMVDILDGSQAGFVPPPVGELKVNDATMAPRQVRTIRQMLDRRVPDEEVEPIMTGATRRLFGWGRVTYEDIFGDTHETRFCVSYNFTKAPNNVFVSGAYASSYNDST